VTEERKEKYDFATYRLDNIALEVPKDDDWTYTDRKSLAGKRIGVGSGTNQEQLLIEWNESNIAETGGLIGAPSLRCHTGRSPRRTAAGGTGRRVQQPVRRYRRRGSARSDHLSRRGVRPTGRFPAGGGRERGTGGRGRVPALRRDDRRAETDLDRPGASAPRPGRFVLAQLEAEIARRVYLTTGPHLPEAVALYNSAGYTALARDIELGIGRLHPFEKYPVPGSPADAGEPGTRVIPSEAPENISPGVRR
jgi:hypothetical protein